MSIFNNDQQKLKNWEKDRKKRETLSKEMERKGVPSSKRIAVTYEDPKFNKRKGTTSKNGGDYDWDGNLLGDLPQKKYGRSYKARFEKLADEAGIPKSERFAFKKYLDANEYGADSTARTNFKAQTKATANSLSTQEAMDKNEPKRKKEMKAKVKAMNTPSKAQRASDNIAEFNASVSNIATGRLWENTLLPMMEAFDDKDKKPSQKLKDLFTGNLNDGKSTYEIDGPDSKVGQIGSEIVGYGLGGLGAGNALKSLGLGAKSATTLSRKALEAGKEGAKIGGLMAGTEVAGREIGRPDDADWKQNLTQVGIEAGAGAVADPLLALVKPVFKGASERVAKNALKKAQDSASKAIPKIGEDMVRDYDVLSEIVKRGNANPNTPIEPSYRNYADINVGKGDLGPVNRTISDAELKSRQNVLDNLLGPEYAEIGMDGFTGRKTIEEMIGLPSPLQTLRPREPLGQNVDVPEGLALPQPRSMKPAPNAPIQVKVEYWKDPKNPIDDNDVQEIFTEMQNIESSTKQFEDNLFALRDAEIAKNPKMFTQLQEAKKILERNANELEAWKSTKELQDSWAVGNRPQWAKFKVPDNADEFSGVPKRFKAKSDEQAIGWDEAMEQAGYSDFEQFKEFLINTDDTLKVKMKDLKTKTPEEIKAMDKAIKKAENAVTKKLRKDYGIAEQYQLLDELASVAKPRRVDVDTDTAPLAFKKQLGVDSEFLQYNRGMNPNERVATRVERVQPEPTPYEAKRSILQTFDEPIGRPAEEETASSTAYENISSARPKYADGPLKRVVDEDPVAQTIEDDLPEGQTSKVTVDKAIEKDPAEVRSIFAKSLDPKKQYSQTIIDTYGGSKFKQTVNKFLQNYTSTAHSAKLLEEGVTKKYLASLKEQRKGLSGDELTKLDAEIARTEADIEMVKDGSGYFAMDFENEKASGEMAKDYLHKHFGTLQSLVKASKKQVTMEQASTLQIAKRVQWLRQQGKTIKTSEGIQKRLDEALASPHVNHEAFEQAFSDMKKDYLDVLQDTGRITWDERVLLDKDPYYVPMNRSKAYTEARKENVDKLLAPKDRDEASYGLGSTRDVAFEGLQDLDSGHITEFFENPLLKITENVVSDFSSAMRNRTHKRILRIAEMEKSLGYTDEGTSFTKVIDAEDAKKANNLITTVVDGEKVYIAVAPDVLQLLKTNDMFLPANFLTKLTGLSSTMKTSSPSYQARALVRDTTNSYAVSDINNPLKYLAEMARVNNPANSAEMDSLRAMGITFSKSNDPYRASQGMNFEQLQKEIDGKFDIINGKTTSEKIGSVGQKVFDTITISSKLGEVVDDTYRLVEASHVKKRWETKIIGPLETKLGALKEKFKGVDLDNFEGNPAEIAEMREIENQLSLARENMRTEMVHRGRDVLNYTRNGAGKASKAIKKYVMFANTATQSKDKLRRSFVRNPVGTITKMVGLTTPVVALQTMAYDRLTGNDQEDYDLIPDYVKTMNYVIPHGEGRYTVIPKMHEFAILTNLAEAGVGTQSWDEALRYAGKEMTPYQMGGILQPLVPNPDGQADLGSLQLPSSGVSPFIDALLNKKTSFNQKQISYDKDRPDEFTSDALKALTGWKEDPDWTEEDPNKDMYLEESNYMPNLSDNLDYLTTQLGGDYGKSGLTLADLLVDPNNKGNKKTFSQGLNPLQDYFKRPDSAEWQSNLWQSLYADSDKKKRLEESQK